MTVEFPFGSPRERGDPSGHIRPAGILDAGSIAALETRVWRTAYRGLLPQTLLDGLSEPDKADLWRGYLRDKIQTFVIEDGGGLLGFAGYGPARERQEEAPAGEIYAIYLDESAWGQGHGRALFERCRDELGSQGPGPLVVWVLRQNHRARRFYERQGMLQDGGEKLEHLEDHPLSQVRYCLTTN